MRRGCFDSAEGNGDSVGSTGILFCNKNKCFHSLSYEMMINFQRFLTKQPSTWALLSHTDLFELKTMPFWHRRLDGFAFLFSQKWYLKYDIRESEIK